MGSTTSLRLTPSAPCGSPRQSKDPIRVDIPPCIRHGLWFRNFLDGVVRTTSRARITWGGKPETDTVNLLLLLAVAVPLSCLAFLSWLALLGVMTLGAVINVIGMARAGRP
jgi:hypothetical protein